MTEPKNPGWCNDPSHDHRPPSERKDREASKQRAADLRLGASGMRYFGDYAEAAAMEAEAERSR
jgi:hypothetical protein